MMGFGDAVASAGPCANNLHLASDRQPRQHPIIRVYIAVYYYPQQSQSLQFHLRHVSKSCFTDWRPVLCANINFI